MDIILKDICSWIVALSVVAFVLVGAVVGIYMMICCAKDNYQDRCDLRRRRESM